MKLTVLLAAALFITPASWAQDVLSAKAGTIHNVTGESYIQGKDLKPTKTGEFPALEAGQRIETKAARAEILLTPGVFLRLGENSEAEMVSNELTNTQVRLLSGSALVEAGVPVKGTQVKILVGSYMSTMTQEGLYRFDASPDRVRVFQGKLSILNADTEKTVSLHAGHELSGGSMEAAKFDRKTQDELYAWSANRSAMVAHANFVAAKSAGSSSGGYAGSLNSWVYVPYLGMYTYFPGNGMLMNPFGYNYYSPSYIRVYAPVSSVSSIAAAAAPNAPTASARTAASSTASSASAGGGRSVGASRGGMSRR